ncbi:MAG: S-layer homology domain-containing protein [Clostridia bacterium]|nr:S-layer homology domain-containing protein [Clostridia bacterium]
MKGDDLIRAFGGISDEMIEEADRTPVRNNRKNIKKIALIAALISLFAVSVIGVGIWRSNTRKPLPVIPEDTAVTVGTDDTEKREPSTGTASDTTADGTDGGENKPADDVDMTAGTTAASDAFPDETRNSARSGRRSDTGGSAAAADPAVPTAESTTGTDERETATPAVTDSTGSAESDRPTDTERSEETGTSGRGDDTTETETEKPVVTDPIDPEPIPEKSLFADVSANDWSYQYIKYVTNQGYMSCRTDDLFEPRENITRAEFVYALYAMAGLPETTGYYSGKVFYHDVEPGSWYYDAILWAKENRIAVGTAVYFSPDAPVTRCDLAIVLLRFADYFGMEPVQTGTAPYFPDRDLIPDYAENAVKVLSRAGVISGKDDGTFDPSAGTSRAEAAVMLRAIIERSRDRTSALLEKYGLDLSVSACLRAGNSARRDQEILVTFGKNGTFNGDIPDMTVNCDIEGAECGVYGLGAVCVYPVPDEEPYDTDSYIYCCHVPYSILPYSTHGGTICANEVLTVRLNISIGGESGTVTVYPSVVYAN